jgi:branched-chain amino acid transport system permease protein
VIGFITVRLTEAYFVIVTALFATVAGLVGTDLTWLTGGSNGLPFEIPSVKVLGLTLSVYNTRLFYYVLMSVVVIVYLVTRRVRTSKLGLVWGSVKANEKRVPFLGYNLFRYKWAAFVVAAGLTGLAGALYALRLRYASVDYLSFKWSVTPVVWALLGGSGTVIGPILGVIIMVVFEYYVSGVFANYMLIVGALLMVLMRWSPTGLVGYLARIPQLWRRPAKSLSTRER